ncbi:hypothetical protein KY314_00260 [Candidatus Woesearchaeota archaeon]|nr:hypothetical protein [Candidatus Woesearchaeota archaeon]
MPKQNNNWEEEFDKLIESDTEGDVIYRDFYKQFIQKTLAQQKERILEEIEEEYHLIKKAEIKTVPLKKAKEKTYTVIDLEEYGFYVDMINVCNQALKNLKQKIKKP